MHHRSKFFYIRHPAVIYHPHLHYPLFLRELPEVNPNQWIASAKDSLLLLKDAEALLTKIIQSQAISKQIMSAAQASKTQTVEKLVQSLGTKTMPKISYNPDGITFNFDHKNQPPHCCFLSIQLKWR
ncbi:hypothetical protein [Niallia sp. NCCP-28]|uniref:hypothetical protein n=1 Tax=Niallia sp. NCCP-28 TaxID=2934712 RepID=UPI00208D467B|nr:hypothetical protein [Niallia sp. NCCP-28]GKU83175.1 hypothetical protein NCCP28_25710 [Niallia sp. NCCP-28]